jgi:hypothetical protein
MLVIVTLALALVVVVWAQVKWREWAREWTHLMGAWGL